jgi:hypothetical protein
VSSGLPPVLLGSLAFAALLALVTYLASAGARTRIRWLSTAGAFSLALAAGFQFI